MDLSAFLGIVGGILGPASFILTLIDRHRRGLQETQRGARGVSGHWDQTLNTVFIRNDGPLPVTLTKARFIPSNRVWPGTDVKDATALREDWAPLPGSRFLRPGEELAFACERRSSGADKVGNYHTLVVAFNDHDGQPWESCDGEVIEGRKWSTETLRFRRQVWLEQRSWMKPIEFTLMRWAVLEAARRPTGPLRWARFLDWLYGWRIGTREPGFPKGQPRIWHYGDLLMMSQEPHLSEVRARRRIRDWESESKHATHEEMLESLETQETAPSSSPSAGGDFPPTQPPSAPADATHASDDPPLTAPKET